MKTLNEIEMPEKTRKELKKEAANHLKGIYGKMRFYKIKDFHTGGWIISFFDLKPKDLRWLRT